MKKKVPITGEFKKALPVLHTLQEAGYEAYFVGGSVRDALLNKAVNDVDIATSAFPEEIKHLFKKTVDVGIEHGTVMVLLEDDSYEVTTFRTESTYQDYRRPDSVTFVRSLKEDLKRRDLTINAFAMDDKGNIQDFFNGERDLDEQVVRAVGKAEERFHEDALRMMRAVRFASQLGFHLEADTFYAIVVNAHLLKHIAVERIRVEFEKMMTGSYLLQGMEAFIETGLFEYCPGLKGRKTDLRKFSLIPNQLTHVRQGWALLLYFLKIHDEKKASQFLRKWRLSNQTILESTHLLTLLIHGLKEELTPYLIYTYSPELALETENLMAIIGLESQKTLVEEKIEALPILSKHDLAINGKELMAYTEKKGGKWLGAAIKAAEKAVVEKETPNQKEAILNWLEDNHYIEK